MVDHDIVRLDVSVHNAHAVAVIQCAQQLIEITLKGRFSMTTFGKSEREGPTWNTECSCDKSIVRVRLLLERNIGRIGLKFFSPFCKHYYSSSSEKSPAIERL